MKWRFKNQSKRGPNYLWEMALNGDNALPCAVVINVPGAARARVCGCVRLRRRLAIQSVRKITRLDLQ